MLEFNRTGTNPFRTFFDHDPFFKTTIPCSFYPCFFGKKRCRFVHGFLNCV